MSQPRLYSKGVILGYRRGRQTQKPNTSLIQIEGVNTKESADYYVGKRVVYVYTAPENGKKQIKTVWGVIRKTHGNSGVLRAKFDRNLAPRTVGARCRVMLY